MTRDEARKLMLEEMAKAFEAGRQAALAKEKKSSNPYGGLEYEAGSLDYPAIVPSEFKKHVGWLRAEWFWGYEDVCNPVLPELEAYQLTVANLSDAIRATDREFEKAYWNACFSPSEFPEATTPEQKAVYEATQKQRKAWATFQEAQKKAGLI